MPKRRDGQDVPWCVLMVEMRLDDVLKSLRGLPVGSLDPARLRDLIVEAERHLALASEVV